MKILIYGINFSPELTGIGKYSGEMAEWLAIQGHEVRVIAAPPYYPEWKVGPGFSSICYSLERLVNLKVYRAPLWVPRKPSGLKRLIHLFTFAVSSAPVALAQIRWRPDVVFTVQPSFFCAPAVLVIGRLCGSATWLHIQDFEVDAAFNLGILKNRWLKDSVLAVERWIVRKFVVVSSISNNMLRLAQKKGVESTHLFFFPNWVDLSHISRVTEPSIYRSKLGIPKSAVVALYSGNMGAKQGLDILADIARLLRDVKDLHFVFCGDGHGKDELIARCSDLSNVRFLELQPFDMLNQLLALADIHLLPQRDDAADLVMPSKLTGMLASGRPVVATARPGTELARAVTNCGIAVAPEDPVAMAEAVRGLALDSKWRDRLGINARKFAEDSFDKNIILRNFEAELVRHHQSSVTL